MQKVRIQTQLLEREYESQRIGNSTRKIVPGKEEELQVGYFAQRIQRTCEPIVLEVKSPESGRVESGKFAGQVIFVQS